ncbi:MAG: CARDB domain-containing protein, partial [Gammaproteobacteria bacterium]
MAHTLTAAVDTLDQIVEKDEANNTLVVADTTFSVADSFAVELEALNAGLDDFGVRFYLSSMVAEFVATVSRGSGGEVPVGPEDFIQSRITVIKKGSISIDENGEPVQSPDEVILDALPMTFNASDRTFRTSLDLINYGTGNYAVTVEAGDGVDSGSAFLTMTVIEEANFTLTTDKDIYFRGEPVHITGNVTTLSGDYLALQKVMIMISEGSGGLYSELSLARKFFDSETRIFETRTDLFGNIDFTFQPNWGDAGVFSVDALLTTRVIGNAGHAEFSILAADISPAKLHVIATTNRSFTQVYTVANIGDNPLTGVQLTILDENPDDNVTAVLTYTMAEKLNPGDKAPVTLTVTIPEDAPDKTAFQLILTTEEGYQESARIRFTLLPAQPVPQITPNEVKVGVNPGGFHTETVTLTNKGMGTMKTITLVGPETLPWVTLTTPEIDELPPGESTTFQIIISPPDRLQLGMYSDLITVTDGEVQAAMRLTVEVSSASRGSVSFVISNDAGQRVENGEIRLVSRELFTARYDEGRTSTYHNIFYGTSNDGGFVTFEDIPVGFYDYSISAASHETVQGEVQVMPQSDGQVVGVELVAVPLSYTWTVTPMVIEDTYDITLSMTYSAKIPKPQFVFLPPWVSVPHELDSDLYDQIMVVNPSLIELHDVTVEVVGAEGITVSSLGQIGTMAPQSSSVLGLHVEPGDYSYLDGTNTYLQVTGTYVEFDAVTLEPFEEETAVAGQIPLVNPEPYKVKAEWGGEIFFLSGTGKLPKFGMPASLGEPKVTEVVKLEINQEATLEREGFDARLELNNGMDRELIGLSISPRVTDANGLDVTDRFYIVPPELDGIATVDGTSNLGGLGSMSGRWTLIPGDGLGSTSVEGKSYWVKAILSYYVDGRLKEVQTNAVEITVHPQPKLYLHYYIPRDVLAGEPFKLGLLVENQGDGIARNLKIDSGQPRIVDNLSGLKVDFAIVGSSFGSTSGDMVRLTLGDILPHSAVNGYWIMTASLDGKVVDFSAEFSHRAYKGIDINPLIIDVSTEIIEHDYLFADAQDPDNCFSLIDRDDDGFPDYLINLTSGLRLPILIPDNATVTKPASETDRTLELELGDTAGYVCVILPDPLPEANLRAITRTGETETSLSGNNFWKANGNIYFVDEVGLVDENGQLQPESVTYLLDFRSALAVTAVDCVPTEFSIIYSSEVPEEILQGTHINPPQGDSLLTTWELEEPIFYIDIPPTEGQKAAIGITIQNNGVMPEGGLLDLYVTTPEGDQVLLDTIVIKPIRAFASEQRVVEWIPQVGGKYTLTASLRNDSPDKEYELICYVNEKPFADGGADFFSEVSAPTTFDGSRSEDGDGYIQSLMWDFGDTIWGGGMGPTHVYDHSATYQVRVIVKDDVGAMSEDVMQVTINEIRPDLVVQGITITPEQPEEGETVTVSATIGNIGVAAVSDTFHVGFYVDGDYREIETISEEIGAGQTVEVAFNWEASAGNHLLTVKADDMIDSVDEADEENNRQTVALYPEQINFADLVVQSISLSTPPEDAVIWGDPIDIVAVVGNLGTAAAEPFRVNFYVDGRYVDYDVIPGLSHEDGDNVATATVAWVPTAGEHLFEVRVDDPISHVLELDETNNQYGERLWSPSLVYADLRVTDIWVWPGDGGVQNGEPLIVYGTVKNDSSVDIPTPIQVALKANDRQVAMKEIGGLAAGEENTLRFTWLPAAGAYDLTVVADAAATIPEAVEENNADTSENFTVDILYPDLRVADLSIVGDMQLGNDVVVAVKVANRGNGYAGGGFNLRLLVNGELVGVERMSQNFLAGTYDYWFFDWQVRSVDPAKCTIAVLADANGEIHESDEGNNSFSRVFEIQESYVLELQAAQSLYLTSEDLGLNLSVKDSVTGEIVDPDNLSAILRIYDDGDLLILETPSATFENDHYQFLLAAGSFTPGLYSAVATVTGPVQTQSVTLALHVAEDFTIITSTDQRTYIVGSPVEISGRVEKPDGMPIGNVALNVRVNDGTSVRLFKTQTLADGSYHYTYVPSAGEGGAYHLAVEASIDGLSKEASGDFSIEGLVIEVPTGPMEMSANDIRETTVVIRNVGTATIDNLAVMVEPVVPHGGISSTVEDGQLPTSLASQEAGEFTLRFTVDDFVGDAEYTMITTWNLGPDNHQSVAGIKVRVQPATPQLAVDTGSIVLGLRAGSSVDKIITITNTGRAELTLSSISDPALPWIQVIRSDQTLLAPGDSTSGIVRISPADSTEAGNYNDGVVISSTGGDLFLPVLITISEHVLGNVELEVVNNLDFVVPDADVAVWMIDSEFAESVAETVVARSRYLTGRTNGDGRLVFEDMLAGTYGYTVSAPYHGEFTDTIEVYPGIDQTEKAVLQFKPLELSLKQEQSTDPMNLGQAQLSVVMSPNPSAKLLTDRPGAEFLVLRSGGQISEPLAYLDTDLLRKFGDNMQFSINNLTGEELKNVSLILEGEISNYLKLYTWGFETIPKNGSAIVSFGIDAAALPKSEDLIVDGSIWIATPDLQYFLKFPIRIRVAEHEDFHNGEPYRYVPYSGPWPTGPILYGEDFINSWFGDTHLASAHATGHSLDNVRLSQDIVMEGEAFNLELSLLNVLPDKDIGLEKVRIIITDDVGADVTDRFDISPLIDHAEVLGALDKTLGLWQIKPQTGQDLGGTEPEGITYQVSVEVVYEIAGHASATVIPGKSIVVKPEPSFVFRYHVIDVAGAANNEVRIELTITNLGPGTARRLEVGFPEIELPTASYIENAGPLVFLDVEPDESVTGCWDLHFFGTKPDVAALVSSLQPSEAQIAGGLPQVAFNASVEYEFLSSKDIGDLEKAVKDLFEAAKEKFTKELDTLGRMYSDLHQMIHTSADLRMAELVAQVLKGATQIMINTTEIFLSLVTLSKPLKLGAPSEMALFLDTSLAELQGRVEAYYQLALNMSTLPAESAELIYNGLFLHEEPGAYERMLEGLFPLIEREDTTAADFQEYFVENLRYYRLKPYVVWDAFKNFTGTPSPEQLFEMLDTVKLMGEEAVGADALLQEMNSSVDRSLTLLSSISEKPDALFPIDLLYNEITSLTEVIEKVGTGFGVAPEVRETLPAYWYSVGDKGAWYPVFLQNWDFGTMSKEYTDFLTLEIAQWATLSEHWGLLADEFMLDAVMGPLSSFGMALSTPLTPYLGMVYDTYLSSIWDEVTEAYQDAYADLRNNEDQLYMRMSDRMIQFILANQYESAGLWQIFSDFENHLEYIIEHNPIDPDVSVAVESTNFGNILVDEGQVLGADMAEIVITNDCDLGLEITPLVRIRAGEEPLYVFEGTGLTLAPGETGTSGVLQVLPRSLLFGNTGYDAEIILDAWDPVTLSREQIGPFQAHFYVGTEDDLVYFDQQSHSQPLGGKVGDQSRFEKSIAVGPSASELKIILLHGEGADLDVHLYDADNRHVGFSELLGEDEILIPGGEFSGSESWRQVITVKAPAPGDYRLVVKVNEADPEDLFAVSALEIPEYGALLETSTEEIDIQTNESEISFYLDALEWGGSTTLFNLSASLEGLTDETGEPLDVAGVQIESQETELAAAGVAEIAVHITLGDQVEDRVYFGELLVRGTDSISGQEMLQTVQVSILIDRQAPAAPQLSGPSEPAEVMPVVLNGTAEANARVEIFVDDEYAGETEADENGAFVFDWLTIGLGDHMVQAQAVDGLGNISELSETITVTSHVDPFTPSTAAALSGDRGDEGWFTSEVTLELTAEDRGGSGVQNTEIAIADDEWTDYLEPASISSEGITKVSFRSTDNGGNEEIVQSTYVRIDTMAPTSGVDPLPEQIIDATDFLVTWSGSDAAGGSGLAGYDIYVSTDEGPFEVWLSGTTETSAVFVGERGHSYGFYSRARDRAGNVEESTMAPDAMTEIPGRPPEIDLGQDAVIDEGGTFSRTGSFSDPDPVDSWTATVEYGDGTGELPLLLNGMSFELSHVYPDDGDYAVTVTIEDSYGKSSTDHLNVNVNNVAPTLTADVDAVTVAEGDTAMNTGTFSDPGADTVTLSASIGAITVNEDGTWSWSFDTA